jgi:hypothetical protein
MDVSSYRNAEFDASEIEARFRFQMQSAFMRASRDGFSISDADLADIEAAAETVTATVGRGFAALIDQVRQRRKNLEEFAGIEFVSLGEDCFSRTLTTRWGLKKPAGLGEKSAPFDLSIHRAGVTAGLIARDFANYIDPADLVFNEKTNHCYHQRLGVQFNHETGREFAADNFAPLIAKYAARVDNFRAVMASGRPLALVFHGVRPHEVPLGERIARLWDVVAARWGSENKRMICINTWPCGAEVVPTKVDRPEVAVLDLHYPRPDYVWHLGHVAFSEDGIAFEARCADFVRHEARLLLPAPARTVAFFRGGGGEGEPIPEMLLSGGA